MRDLELASFVKLNELSVIPSWCLYQWFSSNILLFVHTVYNYLLYTMISVMRIKFIVIEPVHGPNALYLHSCPSVSVNKVVLAFKHLMLLFGCRRSNNTPRMGRQIEYWALSLKTTSLVLYLKGSKTNQTIFYIDAHANIVWNLLFWRKCL